MAKKTSSKRRKLVIDDDGTSSPAAEAIVSIEDLLTEILLRVPAKSLIRFKCVSKNWLRLISDSHFAFNHTRRNRSCSSISGLYFYNPCSSKEQVNSLSLHGHHSLPRLAFHDISSEESTTRIKSSCNGLLLCENRRKVWHVYGSRYVVCNLTTQSYTLLSSRTVHGGFPAYLAFDPSKSPHYKVLSVRHSDKMDIYSSENSSWKRIDFTEPESSLGGVFWNGAIHWLGYDNVHIRFDIDAEKLIETQMPPNPKILSDDKIRYFGECGGRLLLIQTHRRSAMGFRILEMDGDYCGWSVKCRVNLRPLISEFPGIDQRIGRHNFHVLCVVKGENENDFALVLLIPRPGKVIVYNVKCKTTKVLRDLLPGDFDGFIFHPCPRAPFQFIESLSPV